MVPDVSIVMPFRNAALTLSRALGSITAQTLTSWELIAIDDHSTDGGPAIVGELAAHDGRVRLVPSRGRGVVEALNTGCAMARAPFIARMDADDEMMPSRLERQVEMMRARQDLGVVSCLVNHGGDARTQAGFAAHVDWLNEQITPEQLRLARFVDAPVAHPSVLFRRSLLDAHGGYLDGPFPEDYELWLRWLSRGVGFGKVPEVLLTWHDPPGRLSRTDPRYAVDAHARLRCQYMALEWTERMRHECASRGAARRTWMWGAGRITRRRFDPLESFGVEIDGYIDIDPRKIGRRVGHRPVIAPEQLGPREETFVLVAVGNRGARELIRAFLKGTGREEGRDYWVMA